jgi:osmotically-inducible protein OsmY
MIHNDSRLLIATVARVAVVGAALAALLAGAPLGAEVASDPWITQRAKMFLLLSPEVDASELHVDSTNGRVTLFGMVGSERGKQAAERIAGQVIGVRSVRNLLAVVPRPARHAVSVSDQSVAETVGLALRGDPALANSRIHVESVDAGAVVLGGRARSMSEQYRALRIARGVAGVTRVASVIEGPQLLSDAEIWGDAARARRDVAADAWVISAVKVRLIAAPQVPALEVSVDAADGVVTLFGVVPSEEAKRAAEKIAGSVDGVRQVRNELLVQRAERAAAAAGPAGEKVRGAVAAALSAVAALDDADIVVSVRDDRMQLSGRVATQADHLTALTVARQVAAGHAVVDALVVAPADAAALPGAGGVH